MKKLYTKNGFYWILLLFVLWAGASTYWYTCSLKDQCGVSETEMAQKGIDELLEEKVYYDDIDYRDEVVAEKKVVKQKITCTPYLKKSIKLGRANNINEVAKLEKFLDDFEGENLEIDGYYQRADYEAVKRFQKKYSEVDNLGKTISMIDGIVGPETMEKINVLYCIEKGKEYLNNKNN